MYDYIYKKVYGVIVYCIFYEISRKHESIVPYIHSYIKEVYNIYYMYIYKRVYTEYRRTTVGVCHLTHKD